MKTIIITLNNPDAGIISVKHENVTCLGDAILLTKKLHPATALRQIVAVETMDENDEVVNYFDPIKKKALAHLDNAVKEACRLLDFDPLKIVRERDTYNPEGT